LVKHNLTASNKKTHGTSVNTEMKVGENNFCKSKSDVTFHGTIEVSINLLFPFTEKKTLIASVVVVIFLCLKSHQRGEAF
jgi:hypothetical protein